MCLIQGHRYADSLKYLSQEHKPSIFTELRRCVKVDVAVLGSLSLIVLRVSVDVNQH